MLATMWIDRLALLALLGLAAIWVAYPLVIAVLARLSRRRPPSNADNAPTVSVVIAARENDDAVVARVRNCFAAEYGTEKLEVIVAVDGRADVGSLAARLVDEWGERAGVVPGDPPGGKAATLNAAVRAARKEVLVFTDMYQRFEPGTIRALVAPLSAPDVGAASGSLQLRDLPGQRGIVGYYWRYERWLRRAEARLHSSIGVTGAVYAMRRELWRPLPAGLILDDVFVPMGLVLRGSRVAWAEDARAEDPRHPSPRQEYQRKVRTLTGVIQLCAWVPALLHPGRNPVWLQFVFHKLLRLLTPYLAIVLVAWGAIHVWAALAVIGPAWHLLALGALMLGSILWLRQTSAGERGLIVQLLLLQAAVVMATVNGVRGRWDVWR